MGLEVRCINHDPIRLASAASQFGEYPVEHPEPAPTHEPIVDRLMRSIALGGIAPHQPVLDDVNDARDNAAVVDPRNTMRKREKRFDPAHLRLTQQKRNIQDQRLLDADLESTNRFGRKQFNGS